MTPCSAVSRGRSFRSWAEFVEGFERLAQIKPSMSLFGSARMAPDHPHYQLTEEIARGLSDAGFSIVSGGGPGLMEAANEYQDIALHFRHFFRAR